MSNLLFIRGNFLERPQKLSRKLRITKELADRALAYYKNFKEDSVLTPKICKTIKKCLKDFPYLDSHEDIALVCRVDEKLVLKYLEQQPINEEQKKLVIKEYNKGKSINEISKFVNVHPKRVEDYITTTCASFSDNKGKSVLEIIYKHCGHIPIFTLRQIIWSKDLKLQDQLCYTLRRENESEYKIVSSYLSSYKETLDFLTIDMNLTMDDIHVIKRGSKDSVEELSFKLGKIESVINEYIHQYTVHPVEHRWYTELQEKQIEDISKAFENTSFSLTDYKTITTHSFDAIINRIKNRKKSKKVQKLIDKLIHLIFYYLRCSLPFEDIIQLISKVSDIPLTTHDIFHIIFQLSDPVLRGICIEDYSFSNTIPLYYPKLKHLQSISSEIQFEICKELWYCLEQYNGLISFGLGRASWNAVGKSSLLDLIFETDFVKGSPQNSAFHFRSIDIQLTKNLFGETKKSQSESTKWAYIDCHGSSDLRVIRVLCSHLDVALIHVCYNDYKNNKAELDCQLTMFKFKHSYIFLRDCDYEAVTIEHARLNDADVTYIFVPNLTRVDVSFIDSLKAIGYEILHLNLKRTQVIQSQFIYEIIQILNDPAAEDIQMDSELIENITQPLNTSNEIDFSFLNFYPTFVEYMSAYYQVSQELDQNAVDALKYTCKSLNKKLEGAKTGDFVMFFNYILSKPNSPLILRKLSRELSHIHSSKLKTAIVPGKVQKNNEYTLEILWREILLSYKYVHYDPVQLNFYDEVFVSSYSKHVDSGDAFELIDGDNLQFFNNEIDSLLCKHYARESDLLEQINKNNTIKIKPVPIVVSILGPQGSGKSTLLNYCFGCKFLTGAGRCTRGIYASLSKLDRPVSLSQSLLILDTEGLDAIERENIKDTSMIHFDRTMVLFCLAVSQVVIINVKGDIGSEMVNLLQICAYSLNRLKVNKVKAPKIFFVMNQQADPDPNKHLDAINLLVEKLNSESGLTESEGENILDLIQVSKNNLFILPSAFNFEKINQMHANLFDSNIVKLSPTVPFADECANLRLTIIDQLEQMPRDDSAPFQNMSQWMETAGVVWNAILQHREITKWRSLKELKCQEKFDKIATDLVEKHFYNNNDEFQILTNNLCSEIHSMDLNLNSDIILSEQMSKFDEVFEKYKSLCMSKFYRLKENECLLQQMGKMCGKAASNLENSIDVIWKQYGNRIRLRIKSHLNLLKGMKDFRLAMMGSVERYLNCNIKDVEYAFDEIWRASFGNEVKEQNTEYEEMCLSQLYSLFKIEFGAIESEQVIFHWFNINEFRIDEIIESIKGDILSRCHSLPESEQFIDALKDYHVPIKDMIPYNGMSNYSYLCQSSLYETEKSWYESKIRIFPLNFIPVKCHGLLYYCSGYYDQSNITLEPNKSIQVNILKSNLLDPQSMETSAWEKFIDDISSDTLKILNKYLTVSSVVAKEIIHALCFRIRLLNYEIGFIHARLSNFAERSLVNLVFAHAFEYHCKHRDTTTRDSRNKEVIKKTEIFQTFLENIGDYKLIRKEWSRDWMAKWDKEKSQKTALDYIDSVKKELKHFIQDNMVMLFENKRASLSHENLLSLAHEILLKELVKEPSRGVTDVDNFVVQFICNRNTVLERLFQEKFDELELLIHTSITESLKTFDKENFNIKSVLNALFSELQRIAMDMGSIEDLDSDNHFTLIEMDKLNTNDSAVKKLPFKAMVQFLKMYFDPKLLQGMFMRHIFSEFEIDGLKVVASDNYALCSKRTEPILDEDTFQKLVNTGMFNSTELIFNIYEYVKQFQNVINDFKIELKQNEFHEMTSSLRKEFQKKIFGCPSQCPSCGKFCEREIHTNEGKCQIKTGHHISSMGGKVWNADKDNTAVLFMCDDYKNYTRVTSSCGEMEWGEFKDKYGSGWSWILPTDKMNTSKQLCNQNIMKDIWNKFGHGILNHYETQGTYISYVPYTDSEEVEMKKRLGQVNQSDRRGSVSSSNIQIFIDYKL